MSTTYLVGGAVRDKLLGLPVQEKDWVVVGGSADELLAQNFICVGKDFPVFLHPSTKEEYALARTERKVAPGYTGFTFNASAAVTLAEDLLRRDLTINAIAEDAQGNIIDPYHGVDDLHKKLLRHVSPAFVEDPVRILRVARFAARFAHLGFVVAVETNQLMQQMVQSGETSALVAERVWKELHKALQERDPAMFFQILQDCTALSIIFPALAVHYQLALQQLITAAKQTSAPHIRFACLLLPLSPTDITQLCQNIAVPNEYKELALLIRHHFATVATLADPEATLGLLDAIDAFRRPERFNDFRACWMALKNPEAPVQLLTQAHRLASAVVAQPFLQQGISGAAIGVAIRSERLQRLTSLFND